MLPLWRWKSSCPDQGEEICSRSSTSNRLKQAKTSKIVPEQRCLVDFDCGEENRRWTCLLKQGSTRRNSLNGFVCHHQKLSNLHGDFKPLHLTLQSDLSIQGAKKTFSTCHAVCIIRSHQQPNGAPVHVFFHFLKNKHILWTFKRF